MHGDKVCVASEVCVEVCVEVEVVGVRLIEFALPNFPDSRRAWCEEHDTVDPHEVRGALEPGRQTRECVWESHEPVRSRGGEKCRFWSVEQQPATIDQAGVAVKGRV